MALNSIYNNDVFTAALWNRCRKCDDRKLALSTIKRPYPQVLFYSTDILINNAGLHDQDAAYVTLGMTRMLYLFAPIETPLYLIGIGFIFVCMTFVSVVLIDKAGRRVLQLAGLVGLWTCTLLIFGFLMVPVSIFPTLNETRMRYSYYRVDGEVMWLW